MSWQEVSLLFVSSSIFFTWSWAFCHSPVISECFQPCRILVSLCPEACLISASWLPPSPLPLPLPPSPSPSLPLPPPPSSTSEVFPSNPVKPVELLKSCKDVGTSRLSLRSKTACHTVTVTLKLDSLVSDECILLHSNMPGEKNRIYCIKTYLVKHTLYIHCKNSQDWLEISSCNTTMWILPRSEFKCNQLQ